MPPRATKRRHTAQLDVGAMEGMPQSDAWARWDEAAHALLVAQMRLRNVSYKQLARSLQRLGIDESTDRLNRKVNRKRFPAAFLLACLSAMGVPLSVSDAPPRVD